MSDDSLLLFPENLSPSELRHRAGISHAHLSACLGKGVVASLGTGVVLAAVTGSLRTGAVVTAACLLADAAAAVNYRSEENEYRQALAERQGDIRLARPQITGAAGSSKLGRS